MNIYYYVIIREKNYKYNTPEVTLGSQKAYSMPENISVICLRYTETIEWFGKLSDAVLRKSEIPA